MGGVLGMILGGGSNCQACGCGIECEQCTRTCTEPHTGTAFEVVYKRRNGGNLSDGYLNADSDSSVATSSPITGMDGPGPYLQQVGGGFIGGGSGDTSGRFACFYRVSFWRTSAGIGPGGNSASAALTENVIQLTVTAGAIRLPDGSVITAADGTVNLNSSVPLVTSSDDPHINEGTVSVGLECMNVETIFSIQARISWNVKQREHVLYGIVRECYEEENPCATACDGSPSPDVVYVTISNGVLPSGTYPATFPNGTYVLDRYPNFCRIYYLQLERECGGFLPFTNHVQINGNFSTNNAVLDVYHEVSKDGVCGTFLFEIFDARLEQPCGPGFVASGSATWYFVHDVGSGLGTISGTLDWEVSA
jgi:hypothetical protein